MTDTQPTYRRSDFVSYDDLVADKLARMTPTERAEYDAGREEAARRMDAEQLAYDLDLIRRAVTDLVVDLDAPRAVLDDDRARLDLVVTTSIGWRYRVPVEGGRAVPDGVERVDDAPRGSLPLPPDEEWLPAPIQGAVPDAAE